MWLQLQSPSSSGQGTTLVKPSSRQHSRVIRTSSFRSEGPDTGFETTISPRAHLRTQLQTSAFLKILVQMSTQSVSRPRQHGKKGSGWQPALGVKSPTGRFRQQVAMVSDYPAANEPAESTRPLLYSRDAHLPVQFSPAYQDVNLF